MAVQSSRCILDIKNTKKPVFVTQLHERDDDEREVYFPVVQEDAGRLLDTGALTLQRTLVLKQKVLSERVQREMEEKRECFKQRMNACASRRMVLQHKQQQLKERFGQFEKFVQESEGKRRRAIQKYQNEVRLCAHKNEEYVSLCEEMKLLKQNQQFLLKKLKENQKYVDYLQSVIEILPENYLEASEDKINGFIMRYRTLKENKALLIENLDQISDQVEKLKLYIDDMNAEHSSYTLEVNQELSQKVKQVEKGEDKNKEGEIFLLMQQGAFRDATTKLGRSLMAIDNLAMKCLRKSDPPFEKLDLDARLQKIQDYVNERVHISKEVDKMSS